MISEWLIKMKCHVYVDEEHELIAHLGEKIISSMKGLAWTSENLRNIDYSGTYDTKYVGPL